MSYFISAFQILKNMGLVRFIFRFTMISQNAKYVIQPPIKVSFYQNKKNKSCKGQINHVIFILVNDEILLLVEKIIEEMKVLCLLLNNTLTNSRAQRERRINCENKVV